MAERDKKDGEEAKGEENAKPQEEVQGMGLGCGRGIVDRPGSHSGAGREPHRNTEGGIPGFLPGPPTLGESGVGGPTTADWLGHSEVWAGAPRWEVPGSLRQHSGAEAATYLDGPNSEQRGRLQGPSRPGSTREKSGDEHRAVGAGGDIQP